MSDVSTLTLENAKFHCRTCLIKFGNAGDEETEVVDIMSDVEVERLIAVNVNGLDSCANAAMSLDYPRKVCNGCYEQLKSFLEFCKKAKESWYALHSIFNTNLKVEAMETKDEIQIDNSRTSDTFYDFPTLVLSDDNILTTGINHLNNDNSDPLENNVQDKVREEPAASEQTQSVINVKLSHRSSVYHCVECHKRFRRKCHYDAHLLMAHAGSARPYACDQCEKTYKAPNSLEYHKFIAHDTEAERFPCDGCSKIFKTALALKNHRLEQHLDADQRKRFVCELCGNTFSHAKTLDAHKKSKHIENADAESKFKCPTCDKSFQTQYTLKYHILRRHNMERNFVCGICSTGFARKFMLDAHMHIHASEQDKIPCAQCDRRFALKADLEKHVRIVHQKLKQHICTYCAEAFATVKTLRHHVYRHTGEKPYICDICGKAFRQMSAMKTHRNNHTKNV